MACKCLTKSLEVKLREKKVVKMVSSTLMLMPLVSYLSKCDQFYTGVCHCQNGQVQSNYLHVSLNHCFRGLENVQCVLLTHGDSIHKVADQFKVVARSSNFVAGIANEKLRLYGVQFHPEVLFRFHPKLKLQ